MMRICFRHRLVTTWRCPKCAREDVRRIIREASERAAERIRAIFA
jgi:hypothetical protein